MPEPAGMGVRPWPGRLPSRLLAYLRDRFPLHTHVAAGVLAFATMARVGAQIGGRDLDLGIWLAGAISTCAGLLLMRLSDDLGDVELDRIHYPDRSLSRGHVRVSDLRVLGLVCLTGAIGLNASWSAASITYAVFLIALALNTWLIPRVANGNMLVLALTNEPMYAILFVYGFAMGIGDCHAANIPDAALATAALWIPLEAWEIARKTRRAQDEDGYHTYSSLIGRHRAAALALVLLAASVPLNFALLQRLALPVWAHVVVLGMGGAAALPLVAMLTGRSRRASIHKGVERYFLVTQLIVVLDPVIARALGTR
jgi:4-hydroxybenzoate polyprenyltransferase